MSPLAVLPARKKIVDSAKRSHFVFILNFQLSSSTQTWQTHAARARAARGTIFAFWL
jgi:hypothetical protein